jgi:glycosyltransferase involved in cell wall biosynthesis
METIGRYADGVVAVSEATRRAVLPYLNARRPEVSVISAALGVEGGEGAAGRPEADATGPGHMVMLGTIEPRKNHTLVLNVLRQLAQERGPLRAPRLYLVGARGWESENVRALLERSAALKPMVVEANTLSDNAVRDLLRGARALLMPSFAEGYGLPVAEALSLGTPVICSDIPAHREVGGDVPDFLDPMDGPAWRAAILDYADPGSARRRAQISRIRNWRPPSWDAHLSAVLDLVDSVCR